ncbi:DUF1127 domain-containing protein [Microvirga sp. ACRRW]|uniref:DUF1127 domain-containing protein n=1 Tax=Microvirga sp. ACRRW TaxID=2918205 RepID=UPI001EF6BEE8|nr:DUF1127 domain-containing protein [Microvirga sp. ACRRW]MCG7391766.1 DUF1127 domain-containing protein [Microvirga sp. ACRRW]
MMHSTASMHSSELSHYGRLVRAAAESAVKSSRYFLALMRKAAAREQTRQQLAQLDEHMLHDIGLEPLDVYYGWRGSKR